MIVAGVLAALGVDEFRDSLVNRSLERSYLMRLMEDLRADGAQIPQLEAIETKRARLETLLRSHGDLTSGRITIDSVASLVASASRMGWGHPPARRATFDELQSTGTLSLIRSEGLRASIAQYYWSEDWGRELMVARTTDYPKVAYELVRRGEAGEFSAGEMSADDLRHLGDVLATPEFRGRVIAELNRLERQAASWALSRENVESLLNEIRIYLGEDGAT